MLDQQLAELMTDEGLRLVVYDDATGRPIRPQTFVHGHPTLGVGRALDVHGITAQEASQLLANDIFAVEQALSALPWFANLDPVRRGVLTNLAFNLGIRGLETFVAMLAHIAQGNFAAAADDLLQSKWASQVQPSRRNRLIQQLRTGALGPAPHPATVPLSVAKQDTPPPIPRNAPTTQPAQPSQIVSVTAPTDDSDVTDALNQAELDKIRDQASPPSGASAAPPTSADRPGGSA